MFLLVLVLIIDPIFLQITATKIVNIVLQKQDFILCQKKTAANNCRGSSKRFYQIIDYFISGRSKSML